jgi:hypothetical protein
MAKTETKPKPAALRASEAGPVTATVVRQRRRRPEWASSSIKTA